MRMENRSLACYDNLSNQRALWGLAPSDVLTKWQHVKAYRISLDALWSWRERGPRLVFILLLRFELKFQFRTVSSPLIA